MTRSFAAILLILALAALGSLSIVWSAGQTPTLGASDPCPLAQHACDFAVDLNRWLLTDDLDPLLAHVSPMDATCRAEPRSTAHPVCWGAPPDEVRQGYPVIFGGLVGTISPASLYKDMLRQFVSGSRSALSDPYGPGSFRLFGFECVNEAANADCSRQYLVSFGGIYCEVVSGGGDGIRQSRVMLFFLVEHDGDADAPRISVTGTFSDHRTSDFQGPFNLNDLMRWAAPTTADAVRRGLSKPCPDPSSLPDLAPALITGSDLPPSWSDDLSGISPIRLGSNEPVEELEYIRRDALLSIGTACGGEAVESRPASAASARPLKSGYAFYSMGSRGPILAHSVALYEATSTAQSSSGPRYGSMRGLPCAWRDFDANGQPVDLRATALPVPLIGDGAVAIRVDARFAAGDVRRGVLVIVSVRVGETSTILEQAAVGDEDVSVDVPLMIRLAALSAMRLMRLTP